MAKSDETRADLLDVLRGVVDGVKAGTVFGAPVTHKGITVLPVARIRVVEGAAVVTTATAARPTGPAEVSGCPLGPSAST